jgi:hypothetical protein
MNLFKSALLALSLVFASSSFAAIGTPGVPLPASVEFMLNSSAVNAPLAQLGTQVTQKKLNVMKAVYDRTVLTGASGAVTILKDAAGGQAVIPKNAIVKQVIIDAITTPTGGGASIALGLNSTDDLKAATAVASYSGIVAGTPVGTAATSLKVTSTAKAVTATISGGTVATGRLNVFIEYYLSNL